VTIMSLETLPFDIADELHDDEAVAVYLDEALASGDPDYFAHALGKVYASNLTFMCFFSASR